MKRILTLILASLLALSLASCGGDNTDQNKGNNSNNGNTDPNSVYELAWSFLPDENYEGHVFTYYVRKGATNSVIPSDPSSNIVSEAIYNSNLTMKERFNIDFAAVESSSAGYNTDAMNTIYAGDDAYDVILPHGRAAFTYAMNDLLLDWREELIYVDLSQDWWSQDMQKSYSVNGKLYTMIGDISTDSMSNTHCLLFNKEMCDELGLDYPYDLVRSGDWTFDKFVEYANAAVKDLDGDGVIDPNVDRIGYKTGEWSGPIDLIYTGGVKVLSINDQGVPELTLYSQKTVEMFDKYFDFLDTDAAFCTTSNNTWGNIGDKNLFRENRTLLQSGSIGDVQLYRDMEADFGVIPNPKFTKEDEYATIVDGGSTLYCVPMTAGDPIRTSVILEGLAILGARDVIPAYYEISLQTKYARDDESEEMLDIIRASRVYDIGYSLSSFGSAGYTLANSTSHDFASYYAQGESRALENIQEIVEAYE